MDDTLHQGDGIAGRHATAREFAERALAAEARGDQDEADRLFAQADKLDPEAAANVLAERRGGAGGPVAAGDQGPQRDEEVAAITRTVTGHDAKPPAGITGSGSGADSQGT